MSTNNIVRTDISTKIRIDYREPYRRYLILDDKEQKEFLYTFKELKNDKGKLIGFLDSYGLKVCSILYRQDLEDVIRFVRYYDIIEDRIEIFRNYYLSSFKLEIEIGIKLMWSYMKRIASKIKSDFNKHTFGYTVLGAYLAHDYTILHVEKPNTLLVSDKIILFNNGSMYKLTNEQYQEILNFMGEHNIQLSEDLIIMLTL